MNILNKDISDVGQHIEAEPKWPFLQKISSIHFLNGNVWMLIKFPTKYESMGPVDKPRITGSVNDLTPSTQQVIT